MTNEKSPDALLSTDKDVTSLPPLIAIVFTSGGASIDFHSVPV